MLEGLEIAEVFVSEPLNTELFRLEAEFYTANTFDLEKYFRGADIIDFVQYGTSEELNENFEGFPVLRLNEFDSLFIAKPSKYCKVIDKSTYNSLKLEKDDVLICRTNGNPKLVGKSALVTQSHEYAYASYLFKIRPKRELINSATLVVFLNSKYGRLEIEKYSMASNQVNFSPAKFRELRIPDLGSNINQKIENIVYDAFGLLEKSKVLYQQAENILLETLGLKDIVLSSEPVNIKNFSESFLSTGRLDAEYYQKKYEKYTEIINSFLDGSIKIEQACIIADNNFLPMENQIYKYIELANIGKYGDISGYQFCKGSELPTRARRIVHEGDVIVSSIEGSLQSCAIITKEFDKALCSTGFYVIRSNFLNAETLLVLFKSDPIQYLLKQGCSGTILTAINRSEFNNIPIPLIDKTTQIKIADLVKNSFALKQQSEQLLNTAKLAVELAIEEGEEKGLEMIRKLESI